jgi:hypothetical protein
VGERELQVLGDELLDVGALDILVLLQLDDAENLVSHVRQIQPQGYVVLVFRLT